MTYPDWQKKTCGDCGWHFKWRCRRVTWGCTAQKYDKEIGWIDPGYFGNMEESNPACPAFVPREVEE